MAFVNFSLIFGSLLLAVPIVLHLVMRQQPKQLLFPALRFIQQRQAANRRQLQLRHWLLLLLRCLAIALLALALARPSVPSLALGNWLLVGLLAALLLVVGLLFALALVQRRGAAATVGLGIAGVILAGVLAVMLWIATTPERPSSIGDQRAPVAAVLVVDTSPRMQYLYQNQTRLQQAQQIALWLTRQLPPDSEVAVIDSRPGAAAFAVDLAAAERSVERLEITGVPSPLTDSLQQAIELARASSRARKEIYVFTDRTQAAWSSASTADLRGRLAEQSELLLYVIDVGVDDPQNVSLGVPRLADQVLPANSELSLETDVACIGSGGAQTVALYLEEPTAGLPLIQDGQTLLPPATLRAQQVVELANDGSQRLSFRVGSLPPGVVQGALRISGQDGLAVDNQRHFAVHVRDAAPVLILAPPGVTTTFLTEAVAPHGFRETGRARYDLTLLEQAALANLELSEYAAVCLLDPEPIVPLDWDKLARYVADGGGLAVFLGHNADRASFNDPAAYPLLGGRLQRTWRSVGDVFLTMRDLSHPVLAEFRAISTSVPWMDFPVYRHWDLDEFAPQARLLMTYSNNRAALLETTLGRGRTLVMTTPVSDPLQPAGRPPWNELPTGDNAWPYFVLVNEMFAYLVDAGGERLNYLAGETASLPNSRDRYPQRYQLFTPLDQPQDVSAAEDRVIVKFTEYPGAYRLKGFRGEPVVRGFAVNLPEAASDLRRIERDELDAVLGADRYQFARSTDEIVVGVGQARLGREFYPFLVPLVALLLAVEYVLANRFYRKPDYVT
jgi:hypothetical protein